MSHQALRSASFLLGACGLLLGGGACREGQGNRDGEPAGQTAQPTGQAAAPAGGSEAAAGEFRLKIPQGLEALPVSIPADNPLTPAKVSLGRQLYYDSRLSVDNTVACATCHNPRFGFTDGQATSKGIRGQRGGRSAPTTVNRVFSTAQFWDGRAGTLEEQAVGPIANPIEMGMTHELAVQRIGALEGYRRQFGEAFGSEAVTIDRIGKAIAAYERTIISGNAPFDQYKAGDRSAMTPAAQRGLALFNGKARCSVCHTGANFTDEQFHNLGVGMRSPKPDLGRYDVTKLEADRGAFKTPTLRDVALSAPYFHDGSAATLMDVMEHYNKGGTPNPTLDSLMTRLRLTEREMEDLVAFMHALTGDVPLEVMAPPLPEGEGSRPAPTREQASR